MLKVKIKATGEIKEVTRNEAHGMIEAGVASLVVANDWYETRELRTERPKRKTSKTYKSKS